jgi:hypothetical protein
MDRALRAGFGDEPRRMVDLSFAAIGETLPPPAFCALWNHDVVEFVNSKQHSPEMRLRIAACTSHQLISSGVGV